MPVQSLKQRKCFSKNADISVVFNFSPYISQPFFDLIPLFLCSLERKFPEFYKKLPTILPNEFFNSQKNI